MSYLMQPTTALFFVVLRVNIILVTNCNWNINVSRVSGCMNRKCIVTYLCRCMCGSESFDIRHQSEYNTGNLGSMKCLKLR